MEINEFTPGRFCWSELATSDDKAATKFYSDFFSVVNVVAAPMALQYGFLERIAAAFSRHEIVIDVIATSEVSVAMTTPRNPAAIEEAMRSVWLTPRHRPDGGPALYLP